MEIREKARDWYEKNYPGERIGSFWASSHRNKDNQWFFTKTEKNISKEGEIKIFLQKKNDENNFHFLKIPFLFFRENKQKLNFREKDIERFDMYIYSNKEQYLIEKLGLSFAEFEITKNKKKVIKEMYQWKDWFSELATKIAKLNEEELQEKSNNIFKDESINKYPEYDIDPMSFISIVAFRFSAKKYEKIIPLVSKKFDLKSEIPDKFKEEYFYFPKPNAMSILFFGGAKEDKDKWPDWSKKNWEIFKQAVAGKLEKDTFEEALNIKEVGVAKLTQTLFLINAEKFCPIDDTGPLAIAEACNLPSSDEVKSNIDIEGLTAYQGIMQEIKSKFPECDFYEINTLAYLIGKGKLKVTQNFWQISTQVYNNKDDYWEEFRDNYEAYTGVPGEYPLHKAKEGNILLVRYRGTNAKAIGVIYKNGYKEHSWNEDARINVLWINKENKPITNISNTQGFSGASGIANNFREKYEDTFSIIEKLANFESTMPKLDSPEEQNIPQKPDIPLNQIFYGPPGTGKTFQTSAEAVKIIFGSDEFKEFKEEENRKAIREKFDELKEQGNIAFVTFHQSYGYEEFVEGIKPVSKENGQIGYEVCAGIFKQMCEKAIEDETSKYVLIIDEINRGNISKIFGELITLIEEDKRLGKKEKITVKLPYSSTFNKNDNNEEFGVPKNLYIIGTMNTADRSLVLLDTALRRRFDFVEIMPNYKLLREKKIVVEGVDIAEMLKAINERIKDKGSREQQIGHSYFLQLKGEKTIEKLAKIFQRQILPLLEEYFFENRDEVAKILNNNGFYENEELKLEKLKTAESYQNIYEEKENNSTEKDSNKKEENDSTEPKSN